MRAIETIMIIAILLLMIFASGLDSPDPAGKRICVIGCLACIAVATICLKICIRYIES